MANETQFIKTKEDDERKKIEKREAQAVGIEFFNVKTGETRYITSSEHIAAFFNSSDLGPNAKNKQDFGWRLSPEIIVELEQVKENPETMARIAQVYQIPVDDLVDFNILKYIVDRRFAPKPGKTDKQDHSAEYQKKLEAARKSAVADEPEEVEKETTKTEAGKKK